MRKSNVIQSEVMDTTMAVFWVMFFNLYITFITIIELIGEHK